MKKIWILFAALAYAALLSACKETVTLINEVENNDLQVKCVTGGVSGLDERGATLTGMASVLNATSIEIKAYFYYAAGSAVNVDALKGGERLDAGTLAAESGVFSANAEGLNPGTSYSFVASVEVDGGEYFGEVGHFELGKGVHTLDATGISSFSATIGGMLNFNEADRALAEVWFLVGSVESNLDSLLFSGEKLPCSLNNDGGFSLTLDSLYFDTPYYYVACAAVGSNTYYGEVKCFSTANLPLSVNVTTGAVSDVGYHTAQLGGKLEIECEDSLSWKVWLIYGNPGANPEGGILNALKTSGTRFAVSPDESGSFLCTLSKLEPGATYYYVVCATTGSHAYYGSVNIFTTMNLDEVQDLGLSVKWRAWNIGASFPWEYGNFYGWGQSETTDFYFWTNYTLCYGYYTFGSEYTLTKYNNDSDYGFTDDKTVLEPEDDTAHVLLGGTWRMPTSGEMQELIDYCTWKWKEYEGVVGYKVTGPNGNSIFLPTAGYKDGKYHYCESVWGFYWTSCVVEEGTERAWHLWFRNPDEEMENLAVQWRYIGCPIRAVTN